MSVTELDLLPAEKVCPNLFCQTSLPLPLSLPTLFSVADWNDPLSLQITLSPANIVLRPHLRGCYSFSVLQSS